VPSLEKTTYVDERLAFKKNLGHVGGPTFGTAALIVSPELAMLSPLADFIGEVQRQPRNWERYAVNCLREECTS
jgi:hypothetical protein